MTCVMSLCIWGDVLFVFVVETFERTKFEKMEESYSGRVQHSRLRIKRQTTTHSEKNEEERAKVEDQEMCEEKID